MDILKGNTVLNKIGELVSVNDILMNADVLLLYFSSNTCPAGNKFLPKLRKLYEEAAKKRINLRIIYITSDREQEMMKDFQTNHGDWYTIPVSSTLIVQLIFTYNVTAIPRLIVLKTDGEVITLNGVEEVDDLGVLSALGTWL